jgi:Putative transposase, YhgA-like
MTYRPHDALFKAAFGAPKDAAGLLQSVLPSVVVGAIDWSTMSREEGSFVDPDLADLHSDVLFSVQLLGGGDALVYTLIEHQSGLHPDMPLRILGYEVRIWERYRSRFPQSARPFIVPIVLAHVGEGWNEPATFEALFDPPPSAIGFESFVPRFAITIIDLAHRTDDEIKAWTLGYVSATGAVAHA